MVAVAKWMCTTIPYQLLTRRVVLPWALRQLRPAGTALEIGAGSGAMAAQLLAQYPALTLLATDYDAGMVTHARKTLATFAGRATVQQVDAAQLPFENDRFDLVFSFAMLHHVGDWPGAVAEALRVLRPGGRFVGYDALEGPFARLLHCGEGDNVRLMRRGQLEAELAGLPGTEVEVSNSCTGLVVRFSVTKAS
jgi:ubiquinone/menaquinone biosynthesis C-methylase UbiE